MSQQKDLVVKHNDDLVQMPKEKGLILKQNSDLVNMSQPKDLVLKQNTDVVKITKRKDLSLQQKSDLIKIYDTLPKCSQREAALKLGISQSSLCKLIKQRNKIEEEIANNANVSRKRKRDGKSGNVETALLHWFKSASVNGSPISRSILMEKAAEFADLLEEETFVPTDGWLTRWKERHNVVFQKFPKDQIMNYRLTNSLMSDILPSLDYNPEQVCSMNETKLCYKPLPQLNSGEESDKKLDTNYDLADNWIKNILPSLLKGYNPHQIFNTGETSLYFRALPQHTFIFKNNLFTSCKEIKQHITVSLTCNWDGSIKKIPLVIGTCKSPRCFRGIKTLPVEYFTNKNAGMTAKIFADFLLKWDKELKDEKILLFLDNCSVHPTDISLENIKLVFLPADISYILQPLQQGIIKAFKYHYRKDIVRKAINDIDTCDISSFTLNEISRSISLLDAFHMLYTAWEAVGAKTIQNSFKKCGFYLEKYQDLFNVTDVEEEIYDEYFIEYVDIDKIVPATCEKTDYDIVDMKIELKKKECVENESDMNLEKDARVPTAAESRMALEILRRTLELKGGDSVSFQQFYALENTIEKLLGNSADQPAVD